MGNIIVPGDIVYAFAEEAEFGKAIVDDQTFNQLSSGNITINPGLNLRTPDRASGQRYPDKSDISVDNKGSIVTAQITTEALAKELDFWLYSITQKVDEGMATPFTKNYALPATSEVPDFSNDEGLFFSLYKKMPTASVSEKATSMIATSLELSLSDDNNGVLMANLSLLGKGYTRSANPTGTLTKAAQTKYGFHDTSLVAKIHDTSIILRSWNLVINLELIKVGPGIQNFALKRWNVVNNIIIAYDSNAQAALGRLDSGTKTSIQLAWGVPGQDGHLNFTVRGIAQPDSALVESDIEDVSINLLAFSDKASSEDILSIALSNDEERGW